MTPTNLNEPETEAAIAEAQPPGDDLPEVEASEVEFPDISGISDNDLRKRIRFYKTTLAERAYRRSADFIKANTGKWFSDWMGMNYKILPTTDFSATPNLLRLSETQGESFAAEDRTFDVELIHSVEDLADIDSIDQLDLLEDPEKIRALDDFVRGFFKDC